MILHHVGGSPKIVLLYLPFLFPFESLRRNNVLTTSFDMNKSDGLTSKILSLFSSRRQKSGHISGSKLEC